MDAERPTFPDCALRIPGGQPVLLPAAGCRCLSTSSLWNKPFSVLGPASRVLLVGVAAYAGLVLLRVSGKRTLTKMNAFDLVVTVALGSTLATVQLTKSVALADGLAAFALLIFLQYGLMWLSVRF